jgi:signal transduction histidine kinase
VYVSFTETRQEILITTTNYGPALSPEEMPLIYQAGFRGTGATEAGISGFGIGLFFLKDLVERHHEGSITFSQVGEGLLINNIPYRRTEVTLRFRRSA